MNNGIKTILYPVKDMTKATTVFRKLLEVEPYKDSPYYTGFKVGDQDIGLVPAGSKAGMMAFYQVGDIKKSLQTLLEVGAKIIEDVKDVGGGKLVASARDADDNIIGLIQN